MQKNLIIAGLIVWNLILMAALIVLWAKSRRSSEASAAAERAASTLSAKVSSDEQSFIFHTGDRMVGDKAPPIVNRHITLTAIFDTQDKDGVIAAHGGLAQGYAIYVQDGEMFFVARRNNALTTVNGGKVTAGRHKLTATFSKTGEMSVALDGKPSATGNAGGGIAAEPIDGFDVGGDRGAAVGLYQVPNDFGGTIESVSLKTAP